MVRPTARCLSQTYEFSWAVPGSGKDGPTHISGKGGQNPYVEVRGAGAGTTGVGTVGAMGALIFGEHSFRMGHDGDCNRKGVQRIRQSSGEQRGEVRADGTQSQLKCD